MFVVLLPALVQALAFMPLIIAVYLSYQVLKITDLTVEGSFVLGAAIFARILTAFHSESFALVMAAVAGFVAGFVVMLIQRFAKIDALIAGILGIFMLYSVNFSAMGRPNISLLAEPTSLATIQDMGLFALLMALLLITVILMLLAHFLLHSRLGLGLRGYGENPSLLSRLGRPTNLYLALGLGLSNALAAICGVMNAEINGYADLMMGQGIALTAIGAVVIGLSLQKRLRSKSSFNSYLDLLACFCGGFLYFLLMNVFLHFGIDPIHLKLILGLVLIAFLGSAQVMRQREVCA